MLDAIARGLEFWYQKRPTASNWWNNEIGQQLSLEQILILMDGDLLPHVVQTGISYLRDPIQLATYKFTGQNLVWCAGEQFVRGVLLRSAEDISNAVRFMEGVDVVTADGEGIQYDHSFHQHGPQLYNGSYGLYLLKDETSSATLVEGTRFAYQARNIDVLSDYLLNGTRLMVRGKMLDYSAIGREIARPGASQEALGLLPVLDDMMTLRPDKKGEYDALKAHIRGSGAPYSFLGHKHFWNSDFTVHQRAGYYASVKMVSARTHGTETINGENLKGYWIPFGINYIARRGDEYLDIFPVWDWAHLPGVTSPDEVPDLADNVGQQTTFVGGVSDGIYGAAAMKVDAESGTSIHAHKAWFFFDDEIVALGAGIWSTGRKTVSTTLNQSLQRGNVVVDGHEVADGQQAMRDISWVLHDGVGYVFPQKSAAFIMTGPRSGSWGEINSRQAMTPITKNVFAVWLDHGVRPDNATYQYIVVPGTDAKDLAEYAVHSPVRILANTPNLQAVRHEQLGISEIVFFAAGRLSLRKGLTIEVDRPCMLLLRENGSSTKLSVSTPDGPIQLRVALQGPHETKVVVFDVSGGPLLGASQVKTVGEL
jgi:chondroitin AC lyase